jgi:predicted nucleic acid-binding protein
VKYLLDVNVLLAGIWASHPSHGTAFNWLEGKGLVLCPLSGLGFLRISTNQRAFNFAMARAREGLEDFCSQRAVEWVSDDLRPLDSHARVSGEVTDTYLADLATRHGLKFGTLDTRIKHLAAVVVS